MIFLEHLITADHICTKNSNKCNKKRHRYKIENNDDENKYFDCCVKNEYSI